MPCESYKDALIEAAASGLEPQSKLRAHLATCPSCRNTYAEEQSLFASLDAGLHKNANAEVPASLLPRVRAYLDENAVLQRRWMQPLILAASSFVLAAVIFLVARPRPAGPGEQIKQIPGIPAREPSAATVRPENAGPGIQIAPSGSNHSSAPGNSTFFHPVASSQPEVLVPPDEREALVRFVATVEERSDVAAALLTPDPKKNDAPLSLDLLQIADVELKPLEGSETEVSDREGEKH
ncbi:MAG TPA: hypothetical protein VFQ18_07465 [Candidatus Acidoferrum sp.]|nr:hypothetical protein [Candidatus Acidoferrum sp.]